MAWWIVRALRGGDNHVEPLPEIGREECRGPSNRLTSGVCVVNALFGPAEFGAVPALWGHVGWGGG